MRWPVQRSSSYRAKYFGQFAKNLKTLGLQLPRQKILIFAN